MSELSAHEVLCAARNLIGKHGWAQCTAGTLDTGFCVVGAVRYAATGSVFGAAEALPEVGDAFRSVIGTPHEIAWNNSPYRTKAEVLTAFDRAIAATAPSPDFSSLELEIVS